MKPRLKPRIFPEAGECLYDNRSFAGQMADIGVEIIRRKKEEVQVMNRENMGKTTIGERIDQLGLKGLLTVNQVISVPKEMLIALVEARHTNIEMAEKLGIGMVAVSRLRKYYDLPGKPGSKPRDAAAQTAGKPAVDPEMPPPEETEPLPVPESRWAPVPGCPEPVPGCPEPVLRQEQAPQPLLDITDTGIVLAPLAAGVSKMLERIGEGQCRLIITVERV